MEPEHRTAARLLPVNGAGEVLLVEGRDPARPEEWHWVTVGGAVDEGETLPEAAVRELVEETGIVVGVEELTEPVHTGSYPFSWAGRDYVNHATFFAVALDRAVEVSLAGLEPAEVGNVRGAGWWTPEALARAGTAVTPDLPEIMSAAIRAVRGEP
ncbi:NUDIX hydrolase [Nocardioides sp. SYSU D00038]|uniref:NUDIX hydrolase n=1 Tax=Nocardioides sp. SYSU D00038 TaxID=2812554 RepID=UPI001967D24D|nr:NUDIX domain-containing protein [Nocardioides sp. SYSU D00038]